MFIFVQTIIMNRILLISMLLFISLSALSEGPLNIGIKFGTNRSTMITNFDDVLNQSILEEDVNNYLAGAFVRLNLGRLYLQPEAYFNTKGGIIRPTSNKLTTSASTIFDYQTIDFPVLIGIKLINRDLINLRIHGGPVFSYVTVNSFTTEISNFNTADLNNRYVGWQLGAGIDFWFLTIDARIENSSNIMSQTSDYKIRNRVYLLSAGIKLF